MKRIFVTTAIAAAMMTPAVAVAQEADTQIGVETEADVKAPVLDLDLDLSSETDIKAGITDEHDWVGTTVVDAGSEIVGEVERVKLNAEGEVNAIVVETGGVLDIGGREIMVDGEQYMTVADEDGEDQIQLTLTKTAFASMPDFDEDAVSDYPLSDNPLDSDAEMETDTEVEIY